ncbi:chemosensory receptor A [Elysia marginata]|uniref:Chemosensory receptor A n=1 Tax=Elysia marginata TaxID=1093978 RepID=A0AAV4I232_9GAST|nr:chemosensory receptor A [Elysia marginata]
MSAKDIQVVQSVVVVCIIFILSQLPFLLYSTARLIEPEFSDKGRYVYLFRLCTTISLTCSFLNASVNIFVYFTYNSKYRAAFLTIFNVDQKILRR